MIDPPENPVFCTWLPIDMASIHRVRVAGNTSDSGSVLLSYVQLPLREE
jgi:hypothetical protein